MKILLKKVLKTIQVNFPLLNLILLLLVKKKIIKIIKNKFKLKIYRVYVKIKIIYIKLNK